VALLLLGCAHGQSGDCAPTVPPPPPEWRRAPADHAGLVSPTCNIPRVSALQWEPDYTGAPVIIHDWPRSAVFAELTRRAALLERYGTSEIVLSSVRLSCGVFCIAI
jgi:hypothetical protein